MNTFHPRATYTESAADLDRKRCGKIITECNQMLQALTRDRQITSRPLRAHEQAGLGCLLACKVKQIRKPATKKAPTQYKFSRLWNAAWANHPHTLLWRNHIDSLADYAHALLQEWLSRGYTYRLPYRFEGYAAVFGAPLRNRPVRPWFVISREFQRAQQAHLMRKDPVHYGPLYPDTPITAPYLVPAPDGSYTLIERSPV